MKREEHIHGTIRRLGKDEGIPYDLLLLADETVEAIDRYIHRCEIYVLEREKRPVALYALQFLNRNEAEIKNIAVAEDCRGKGIGMLLLKDAEARARERGHTVLLICTGDAGTRQIALYRKAGFEIFTVKKNFFIDNYPSPIFENGVRLKDMIMLRKAITPTE